MNDKKPMTFPDSLRMKTPEEFKRVYDRKKSASDGTIIVYACENHFAHPRLGVSVSKKVGNAEVLATAFPKFIVSFAKDALPLVQFGEKAMS